MEGNSNLSEVASLRPLHPCSKKKKKETGKKRKNHSFPNFLALRHFSKKKKKKKKKNGPAKKIAPPPNRITRIVRRTTTTTTTTTSVITTSYNKEEEEDQKKISIYICVVTYAPHQVHNWYKIDPNKRTNHTKTPPILDPICHMPESMPCEFHAVALGTRLYTIGGYTGSDSKQAPSKKVFVCDTLSTTTPVWEECPSMASPRDIASGVTVNENIYVFGSKVTHELNPWGEVFDLNSNSWAPFPPPPPDLNEVYCSAFAKERGEIIVVGGSQTYCFHVKSCSWKKIPVHISPFARPLVVGDTLYTFTDGMLFGRNLDQPEPLITAINGLEEEISQMTDDNIGHLFYIGKGKLCLVWSERPVEWKDKVIILCLRFWVGMRNGCLHAVIDRCESYLADGCSVTNFVAV